MPLAGMPALEKSTKAEEKWLRLVFASVRLSCRGNATRACRKNLMWQSNYFATYIFIFHCQWLLVIWFLKQRSSGCVEICKMRGSHRKIPVSKSVKVPNIFVWNCQIFCVKLQIHIYVKYFAQSDNKRFSPKDISWRADAVNWQLRAGKKQKNWAQPLLHQCQLTSI